MVQPKACKLCGGPPPIRNSHIIPEFAYVPVYDNKHRALAPDRRKRGLPQVQKGFRERLLCDRCEQRFCHLERYFDRTWNRKNGLPDSAAGELVEVKDFDFKLYKLFHLSVLWRAAVASTAPFDQVNLGPHQRSLQSALVSEDPPPEDIYPIYAFALRYPDTSAICREFVIPPTVGRHSGVRAYCTVFSGCAWYCFVSTQPPPFPNRYRLSQRGSIIVPVLSIAEFPPIVRLVASWKRMNPSYRPVAG